MGGKREVILMGIGEIEKHLDPAVFIRCIEKHRMRNILSIDATGLKAIRDLYAKMKKERQTLILSGIHAQP
jgi:hypothetical protein